MNKPVKVIRRDAYYLESELIQNEQYLIVNADCMSLKKEQVVELIQDLQEMLKFL